MAMNICFLLGGMSIFVCATLYSVITRMFFKPEPLPRRRRPTRPKRRWYKVWFKITTAPIVNCFLSLWGMICDAFAALPSLSAKSFRTPDDPQKGRRSPANASRCQNLKTKSLSAPSSPPTRSARALHRKTGSRAPPPTPMSSSESRSRTPTRPLRPSRLPTSSQVPLPSPTSCSGDSTLIGTPSRVPSIAPGNVTAQATQVRPDRRRLHELEDFIASASVPPFQEEQAEATSEAFKRLTTYMHTKLHISPGTSRLAALLSLIYGLHFAIAPERKLPLQNLEQSRYISCREIACVFLNRYGPIVWPAEPEPAPHLTDRALQYPRDATINERRHEEWRSLMVKPPVPGSAGDLAMSVLGERMTAFVRLMYKLPLTVYDDPDWDAAALVLDDTKVGQQDEMVDGAGLSEALRRSIY